MLRETRSLQRWLSVDARFLGQATSYLAILQTNQRSIQQAILSSALQEAGRHF
jgi:hypothetical protein